MALPGWYSLFSVVEIHATLEGVAIAFFAALVVFDVLAHLKKERETVFERIALVCFGVAVLAEVCAYPYSRRIDTLSSEANAVLIKEAGDARRDADLAAERASKNEKEAAGLRKAAEDERLARVKLQERMLWLGPREYLIQVNLDLFIKDLTRFRGQRFRISICKLDLGILGGDVYQTEVGLTASAIRVALTAAKWERPTQEPWMGLYLADGCTSTFIGVRTPKGSSGRTNDAALALQSVINQSLSDNARAGLSSNPGLGGPDPSPDVIEIHVGKHPAHPLPAPKK